MRVDVEASLLQSRQSVVTRRHHYGQQRTYREHVANIGVKGHILAVNLDLAQWGVQCQYAAAM